MGITDAIETTTTTTASVGDENLSVAAAAAVASMLQNSHHNFGHFPTTSPTFSLADDIKKFGYMRKQKTNKRKFFVLRLNHYATFNKATLSYYDSEKKFRDRQPRRTILLVDCFAVARIPDHKKYVLGIYTKDDLLATVCDDEKQLIEWLQAIRFILYRMPEYLARPFRDFHYIWQGNINRVGDGMPRSLMGIYRFCLLPTVLYLIRVDPTVDNPKYYEFPLSIIHHCGHKERTFYLKIGRLSELGAGEFWILTDDNIIAEHMHAKVSSFWTINNKGGKLEDGDGGGGGDGSQYGSLSSSVVRPRSSSTSTADQFSKSSNNNSVCGNHGTMLRNNNRLNQSSQQNNINNNRCSTIGVNHRSYHSEHGNTPMSISPFMWQQLMAQFQSFCHMNGCNNCNGGTVIGGGNGTVSSSSQSPTNSRERLHSGSWSRTASDCSNEDISVASTSAATTPIGPMNWDSAVVNNNANNSINNNIANALFYPSHHPVHHHHHHHHHGHHHGHHQNCSSPNNYCANNTFVHGGYPVEYPKANSSSSSLSTEFDNTDQHLTMDQLGSMLGGGMFEHHPILPPPPPVSSSSTSSTNSTMVLSEEKGYGADLDLYSSAYGMPQSSSSSSYPATSFCSSCMHQYSLFCMQMFQNWGSQQQQHRSPSSQTNGSSHNQSPVTSPKCHCASCLQFSVPFIPISSSTSSSMSSCCSNNNNSNNVVGGNHHHHYLPTIPAGEPSDYVPMKPGNGAMTNNNRTNDETSLNGVDSPAKKLDDDEGESYLLMAPLSPTTAQNVGSTTVASTSNASVSNSMEFNLEKVKSYISSEEETNTTKTLMSSDGGKNVASQSGAETKATKTIDDDDTIFNGLTRAYSTGSKPQPLAPSIGSQLTNNAGQNAELLLDPVKASAKDAKQQQQQPTSSTSSSSSSGQMRTRASSTGSHGMKFRAFLLSSRRKNKQNPPICPLPSVISPSRNMDFCDQTISSMGSSCSLPQDSSQPKANKAASAPILSSLVPPRVRSHTLGSKPSNFMMHLFGGSGGGGGQQPLPGSSAAVAATNPILFPMIPDVLTNMYGVPSQLSLACCHPPPHLNHGMMCPGQTSQPQSTIAPQSSLPEEGDLMEIDYSAKSKERSQQKQNHHHHHHHPNPNKTTDGGTASVRGSESGSEEETSKETRGKEVAQSKNENEILPKQDGHNQLSKRSESATSKSNSNNANNNNNHHNPLDSLVTAVKHLSLSSHNSSSKHHSKQQQQQSQDSSSTTSSTSAAKNVPNEDEYMLLDPSTKSTTGGNLSKSLPNSEPTYPMMNFGGGHKMQQTKTMMMTTTTTTTAPLASNESDEESSYVWMAPENVSKSSSASNHQKKHKGSGMRSLFSTPGSSIFRIHRNNSARSNNNNNNNNSNHHGRKSSLNMEDTAART